jgi:hypothetical protein
MPPLLDRNDRQLVIGAIAVMLLLVLLTYALRPAEEKSVGIPSSYSDDWLGTKAAFLLLQESGYDVERWELPPQRLPKDPTGTTLVFAEPTERGSADDRAAVSKFVQDGGRLLVMGATAAEFAPLSRAMAIPSSDLAQKPYSALTPSPLSRNAPVVTMVAPDRWLGLTGSQLAIYGTALKPGVVSYRYGKGQVIWWAISSPASNGSIREQGNLALLLNSVGPPASHVLWDEYFHGMRPSLSFYIGETPLPWAGLQIAVVFLAALFTFSRRSGPILMPLGESRLSPLEFVDTLGDLYESAQAAPVAVEIAYERFRQLLARKLSAPSQIKLPELCQLAAEQLGWPADALRNALGACERAMRDINLSNREALELVGTLHDYTDRLDVRRAAAQEKSGWK